MNPCQRLDTSETSEAKARTLGRLSGTAGSRALPKTLLPDDF